MEFFTSTQLTIPFIQVALLLILTTVALLIGRLKLALLINYSFTLYWGYFAKIDDLSRATVTTIDNFMLLYFGFGFVVAIFAMIGLFAHKERKTL
jgi:hypothetical protein